MKDTSRVAIVVLGLMVCGLIYVFYFKPRQSQLSAARVELVNLSNELTGLRAKKVQLDKFEAELVGLNKSLSELEAIIPQKKESGEILRSVQQMAMDTQLDLIHYTPDKEIPRDFYSEQPIPIQVIGSYHNLGIFFDRILHYQRLFNIDDFTITALPVQNDQATLSAVFTARTYFFFSESQIRKIEANKPQAKPPAKETDELR